MKRKTIIEFSMPKGFLEIEILMMLKKPMHGYEIMKFMRDSFSHWSPSPGSIYPILRKMEKNRMISKIKRGRKNIYKITEVGRKSLKDFRKLRLEIKERMVSMIGLLGEEYKGEMMNNLHEAMKFIEIIERDKTKKKELNILLNRYLNDLKDLAKR